MSLSPTYKNFNSLSPIYFLDPDNKIDFISQDRYTLQGLNLLTYNISKSANDSFVKNYTVNNLVKGKNSNDIFSLRGNIEKQDLNTKLGFKSTQNTLSAGFFLQCLTNKRDDDSVATFNIDVVDNSGNKFLVDFKNEDLCTVSLVDGKLEKFLFDDPTKDALIFKFIGNIVAPTSSYEFNYFYDDTHNKLRLFKDGRIVTVVETILVTQTEIVSTINGRQEFITIPLSSTINSIGLSSINEERLLNGTIGVEDKIKLLQKDNIDQFTYYDYKNNYALSNDTVSGIKYDFLTYYTYNNIISGSQIIKDTLARIRTESLLPLEIEKNYIPITDVLGTDPELKPNAINVVVKDKTYANLNFFNLKNHISSDNIVYGPGAEDADNNKEYRGREYQNFTNQKSKETDSDNITLNYTFFDSEFKIGSKDFTAFTMPNNLFPFRKININDTGLAGNGSFAANNPYFSDKVFKLTDTNKNNLQNTFIEDEEFLVLQNDVSLFVLQSGDLLGFQSINDIQENDIFGSYLCTWLKGDGVTNGVWYDRYYLPKNESYTISFSGVSNLFENSAQAAEYFKTNETNLIYYDLMSNFTFEPSASYVYQRINDKQINEYIDGQKDKLLRDTFTIQTSSVQLQNINEVNLNTTKGFDNIDIQSIPNRDFNVGFELELDTLSSLDSFQLMGNLYEDGFSLKNNHFFTPFIFIPQGNVLYIYDNNFKLLRTNTYESTENILDVLYIEQNNNFVLVCDNKLIKTNYFGETLAERSPTTSTGQNLLLSEVVKSYKSKTYYGYNNVLIFTNEYNVDGPIINLDLNNLVLTKEPALNLQLKTDPFSGIYQSLVPTATGYRFLEGQSPVKIDESVACSLDNSNRFISTQFIPGEAFRGTPLFDSLSGGVIAGRSFTESDYDDLLLYSGTNPAFTQYFTFRQAGRARIIFDLLESERFEDPILDSINSKIYDINSADSRLFVQYVNLTASQGYVQEFTSERFRLSAYELSNTVAEGYKLDFIEENKQLKILSFARDLSSNIVIDKINATTGLLENTYSIPITGSDITSQTVYIATENIASSVFSSSNSLSAEYNNGIYYNRRFNTKQYSDIINFNGTLNTKFDTLTGSRMFINPTSYYSINQKYSSYRDKLIFKFNLNSLTNVRWITEKWNEAGPPLSATGYSSFEWTNPALGLSAWDGSIQLQQSEDTSNVEIIFEIPNLDIKNYINLDFDINSGKIRLYNNGLFIGDITFEPNLIPIERIIYPELFINTQNIRNTPIDNIVTDISYNSKGGLLKNFKVHNTSFETSLINYLELQTKSIDPLYFRVPCATRNKTEEIDTMFNYNIPGNISNYVKVNIKNIDINNDVKAQLEDYLKRSVKVVTPSQQKLIYNVD
tara:strand:+ start:3300 stop:7409 length:4110 start_codon:yes stop_codon:yes gene_type:complete